MREEAILNIVAADFISAAEHATVRETPNRSAKRL
jgi:hypothetical protein